MFWYVMNTEMMQNVFAITEIISWSFLIIALPICLANKGQRIEIEPNRDVRKFVRCKGWSKGECPQYGYTSEAPAVVSTAEIPPPPPSIRHEIESRFADETIEKFIDEHVLNIPEQIGAHGARHCDELLLRELLKKDEVQVEKYGKVFTIDAHKVRRELSFRGDRQ